MAGTEPRNEVATLLICRESEYRVRHFPAVWILDKLEGLITSYEPYDMVISYASHIWHV